jgi:hypothetical protein
MRDELAPPQLIELHSVPSQGRIANIESQRQRQLPDPPEHQSQGRNRHPLAYDHSRQAAVIVIHGSSPSGEAVIFSGAECGAALPWPGVPAGMASPRLDRLNCSGSMASHSRRSAAVHRIYTRRLAPRV